jgi:hypothetical protein
VIVACGGAQQTPPTHVETLPSASVSASASASASTSASASVAPTPSATTTSARSPEIVVMAMRADLRRCYNKAVKTDPNLRAAIKLTIDVAPDGSVTKVTPHATPPVPTELEQCLVAAASRVAFDPPGGSGASFELPINLVPANP